MSERIARIEESLKHLTATVSSIDAKLDKMMASNTASTSDNKALNSALVEKFVHYDKELDKKPSKNEVQKWISDATTKQIMWTIASAIGVAAAILKFVH